MASNSTEPLKPLVLESEGGAVLTNGHNNPGGAGRGGGSGTVVHGGGHQTTEFLQQRKTPLPGGGGANNSNAPRDDDGVFYGGGGALGSSASRPEVVIDIDNSDTMSMLRSGMKVVSNRDATTRDRDAMMYLQKHSFMILSSYLQYQRNAFIFTAFIETIVLVALGFFLWLHVLPDPLRSHNIMFEMFFMSAFVLSYFLIFLTRNHMVTNDMIIKASYWICGFMIGYVSLTMHNTFVVAGSINNIK